MGSVKLQSRIDLEAFTLQLLEQRSSGAAHRKTRMNAGIECLVRLVYRGGQAATKRWRHSAGRHQSADR
jgi:hypothetical protein